MSKFKKILALVLTLCVICTIGVISVNSAEVAPDADSEVSATTGITIHYYCESGTPTIYYWNALPQNKVTNYPGPAMTSEGNKYYKYTFSDVTKINFLFVTNGVQSDELTRTTGEWWYKDKRWYNHDPSQVDPINRTDLRGDSIYFVITTRFYDGDTGNNVHCWEDKKANNPDSDPAWRGDFKGLIDKLDYIKALGFSAIWVTPVVENASGYDYHGYHAFDFSKVDPRYESSGADFQALIDAVHAKGMKIVQDVVWNHTGNFGENKLCHMFDKQYNSIQDLGSLDCMKVNPDGPLAKSTPNYSTLNNPDAEYAARLNCMKTDKLDTAFNYHHSAGMDYEQPSEQTGQMAGDCVDVNTENQKVADYLNSCYMQYVDMGVDAFRLDTEKHINRWTLNNAYFPVYKGIDNFFIFGEVCARVRDNWNHGIQSDSPAFYGWAETESAWKNNWSTTNWQANLTNSVKHFEAHNNEQGAPTSSNAFLGSGNTYHTPDYSKSNGTGVIDFKMHWSFENASTAYAAALDEDRFFNDSTYNVMYVDSHDYGPDGQEKYRYKGGEQAWAENMDLMFTFRGIPCIFYGSEIQFKNDVEIDVGPGKPLEQTGRAYFGNNITGNVTATDFGKYTGASGNVATTLNKPLAKHLQQLNQIRRAVPALQMGQYASVGNMAYVRRYTKGGVDSLACVAISGGATFKNIPNGKYIDAVTGDVKTVTNGTLTSPSVGKGNMRVYVCCASGFKGISGKIGTNGTYLK